MRIETLSRDNARRQHSIKRIKPELAQKSNSGGFSREIDSVYYMRHCLKMATMVDTMQSSCCHVITTHNSIGYYTAYWGQIE